MFLEFNSCLPPLGVVTLTPSPVVGAGVKFVCRSIAGHCDEALPQSLLQAFGGALQKRPRRYHGDGGGNDILRQFAVPCGCEVNVCESVS